MSDSDENFMEVTSYSASQASPSPRMTSAMMDQTENGLIPIGEILPQTNLSNDHQSDQRSSHLGRRLTANIGIDLPSLETQNVSASALLQSPNMFSNSYSQIVPLSPVANARMIVSNNGLPHQRMGVDQAPEDHNLVDVLVGEASFPERRGNETSNMIASRVTRQDEESITIKMESEENPDDGFRWKKYGQKLINGKADIRSYYKCTFVGCNVRKYVDRGAANVKSFVITYYGRHAHNAPVIENRSGSSMSQDPSNRTPPLGRAPSSSSTSQVLSPSLELQLGMPGLSILPSLPDNQNDEPKIDRAIPDGT